MLDLYLVWRGLVASRGFFIMGPVCFSYHVGVPSRGVPSVGFPSKSDHRRLSWRPTNHKSHRPLQCHCMPPPPNSKWIEKICSHDWHANQQTPKASHLVPYFSVVTGARVCAEFALCLKGHTWCHTFKMQVLTSSPVWAAGQVHLASFWTGQFTMALHLLTTLAIIQQ